MKETKETIVTAAGDYTGYHAILWWCPFCPNTSVEDVVSNVSSCPNCGAILKVYAERTTDQAYPTGEKFSKEHFPEPAP